MMRVNQLAFWLLTCALFVSSAQAATNIGRANLGADPTIPDSDYITDSPTLTINAATLAVVKKAFIDDNSGTEIASGSSVVKGTVVKFLIYLDNTTNAQASDVRLEDLLDDASFTYIAGTLKWNVSSTATAATTATIFTDANSGTALTDAIDGDVVSINTTLSPDRISFGAHSAQANAVLNVPAGRVVAFLFRATVR